MHVVHASEWLSKKKKESPRAFASRTPSQKVSKNDLAGGGVVVHVNRLLRICSRGRANLYQKSAEVKAISSKNAAAGASPRHASAFFGRAQTVAVACPGGPHRSSNTRSLFFSNSIVGQSGCAPAGVCIQYTKSLADLHSSAARSSFVE